MERHVEPDQSYFTAVHTAIENVELDGERVLRVVKSAKIDQPDENTYAKLTGSNFHNGAIEVDMRSRLLPDAPGHARGFIGIAFRMCGRPTAVQTTRLDGPTAVSILPILSIPFPTSESAI